MIVSKIETKLQFHYVVLTQYEYRTAGDTHSQYNCAQEQEFLKALNVTKLLMLCDTTTCHKGVYHDDCIYTMNNIDGS